MIKNAEMSVFEILAQNNNNTYNWGKPFNAKNKKQSISVTVKLKYEL